MTTTEQSSAGRYEYHAPFAYQGRWTWLKFTSDHNLHTAVATYAAETGADAWDTSQASARDRRTGDSIFGNPSVWL